MRHWKTLAGETVTLKGLITPTIRCYGCRSAWKASSIPAPERQAADHAAACREVRRPN
ncbi:hypothetical protein ACIQKB_04125 [Streptomyces sp. NPDC092046]|uniref:hypothetical protein n=1 Tax=Streptomyces sp. NPDC092046 TaxID=3366009 RepID=UPI003804491E